MVHLKKYKKRLKPTTPPPMQWRGLEELGDNFRIEPSEDNLTLLLQAWEKNWLWSWSGKPPTLEHMIAIWREMVALIATKKEEDPPASIRYIDKKRAGELLIQVNFEFIFGGLIVVNAELCFLNREALVFESMSPEDQKTKKWFEMIFINRLMLALEWFATKIVISEDWLERFVSPSPYEVMVARVQKALECMQ